MSEIRACLCGCNQPLGTDPRAKYASGACRVRAYRKRSVTSVSPGKEGTKSPSDPLQDPSVTSVTGDSLYEPGPDEDEASYGSLPKGLTYKEAVAELKRQIKEIQSRYRKEFTSQLEAIRQLEKQVQDLTIYKNLWKSQEQLNHFFGKTGNGYGKYSDLVKLLEETPDALKTVRAALSKKFHPDHNPGVDTRYIQQVNVAFDKIRGKG